MDKKELINTLIKEENMYIPKGLVFTDRLNDIMREMDARLFEKELTCAERIQKACAYAYEQLKGLFQDMFKCTYMPDEAYRTIKAALDAHNGGKAQVIQEGSHYAVLLKECFVLLASGGTVFGRYTNDPEGYAAYLQEQWRLVYDIEQIESMACVLENLTEQEFILLEWASHVHPLKTQDGTLLFTSYPMLADIEELLEVGE